MRPANQQPLHRAAEAARPQAPAAPEASAPATHKIRLATPAERDAVGEYLRSGGWLVEPVGRRDLRARYPHGCGDGGERVNLRFSLALWRTLNKPLGPRLELR